MTFDATVNPVAYEGGELVFIDTEYDTWNMQTMLISDRGKDGVGKSSIPGQFLRSANKFVYVKWPIAKKNKLLLPVGWIVFGTRRAIRELVGKRKKTNIKRVFDGADQRRKLYSQLHLYEAED